MPEETTKDKGDKLEVLNNIKTRSSDLTIKSDETASDKSNTTIAKEKDTKVCCSNNNNNNALKIKGIDKSSEPLLGSTFLPNSTAENGHTLRASARVIHKLRMDSATPNSPPVSVLDNKKEDESSGKKKEEHRVNPKTPSQPKTAFRMTWNNEEKDMFFDALNEYGRDFEAISTYINNKQKRKNPTDPFYKTKDQVRVLYYQFYQKVSKYLKFSDEVKKVPQELYALINYGEMRKKLIFINEKSFLKLRELVYKGSVTIRTKGKNIKIKTPSCRALRKLNQLEEWQEEIKLPHRIDVILRPANVDAWGKVQSLAHNPRIRTQVPLQRRVSSLLQTLQHRWRSQDLRLQEKIMSLEKSTTALPSKSKSVKAQTFESEFKKQACEPLLCFAPPPEQPIHRPVVHLSEFLSSDSICLNSYEQRIGVSIKGESLCSNAGKRVRQDSGSGDKVPVTQQISNKSPEQKRQKLEIDVKPLIENVNNDTNEEQDEKPSIVSSSNDLLLSPNSSSRDSNEQNTVLPIIDSNLDLMDFRSNDSTDYNHPKLYAWNDLIEQATLSESEMKTDDSNDGRMHNSVKKDIKIDVNMETACDNGQTEKKFEIVKVKKVKNRKKDVRKEATHFRPLISQKVLQEIRDGWTTKNAGDLTFGDLYVMFGESSKLYLEYSWVQVKEIEIDSAASNDLKSEVQTEIKHKVANNECISVKLRQLLMVAQLQDKTKRRGTCVCGHVCDHRKLNKTNNDLVLSPQNNESLFKHPNVPNRRTQMFNTISDGNRMRLSKLYRPRMRPMFTGKQVIVQRLLPVQPGANHSYGVVTNSESSPIASTSKQNSSAIAPEETPNNACTVTIQTIDGEISQLLTAKMNQLSETKTPAELCNTDSFKSLMELSLSDVTNVAGAKDLSDDDQEYVYPSTPLMSPMRILHESPIDGYNVEDVSLSSILGHLENACNPEPETEQSDNVSLITEPSIDYIARFEDMTAELQNN
ncbi:protein cramped [Culicoides brevitarsis]|uniref:protein cramped n=1 Tax=Culicoides brevitarsis TaxID=469753 RepID=UPI00307C3A5A